MHTVPETYIQDSDRAVEIAYASKRERGQIIGARLVDQVINPSEPINLDDITYQAQAAARLFEIYKDYPEVFEGVISAKSTPSQKEFLKKLPDILKCGGLPVRSREDWGYDSISIEEIEQTAALREVVAEAIFDAPPTDEFLRERGIQPYKFSQDPVGTTVSLLHGVGFYKEEARRAQVYLDRRRERRQESDKDNPKMKSAIRLLEDIYLHVNTHTKDCTFEDEVIAALNEPATTLADLELLIDKGVTLWVGMYHNDAERAQETFDSIVSGEASQYAPVATPA